jgi:hypothetical protein
MSNRGLAAKALSAFLMMAPLGVGCAAGAVEDPPAATTYATLDEFCKGRAAAECSDEVVAKCGAATVDACVTKRVSLCKTQGPQGVTFIPAGAEKCIATLKDAYADAKLDVAELASFDDVCGVRIFSGPGAARASCRSDYDCRTVDGLRCTWPQEGATEADGRCLVPNPVAAAGACPGEADVCPGDYFCESKSKTCAPRAAIGETCRDGIQPCLVGLVCPNNPFAGGCREKAGPGEPCKLGSDCTKGLCDKAVGATSGNCTETISLNTLDSICEGFK